ncbi:serine/threonine-protein kinase [Streptomyces pinistramenti]|uniref:serine/threonine-protein kinase n=1 Tax=Streptomyces pinistramenti TaxID=2884812 RepID=UPI001D077142|nr:serine/threonine-protein kinase [Streptomyces pinistramenti]MCB5909799.1 PQQ-binding-like beta-propeller repeat protein [Streptomyces pinistramenti]
MDSLLPDDPQSLGPYRLLGRIGAGGMGRVYLARSAGGRTVAVKVVRPDLAQDTAFRGRFRQEVEIARAVSGRYTAPVVDADTEAALPWLATAFVLGPSLTEVIEEHGALPERSVRALGAGLAAALTDIHAVGLVHRDLKPSNVLLAADGPRVIDFGIARAVDGDRMTQTGVVVGSPGYIPPEQALGRPVGTAGDIFAFGAVLAYASTGHTAYGDTTPAAVLYQVVHGEPDLTGVPGHLLDLVAACLRRDPAQRPTPAQVREALAPDGTGAVLANWLPGAVSSTIATHAARILDLETPEHGTSAPPRQPTPGAGPDQGAAPAATPPGFGSAPTYVFGAGAGPGAYGAVGSGNGPGGGSSSGVPTPAPSAYEATAVGPGSTVDHTANGGAQPSRRRFFGLAAAAAAGVAVVGGGGVWALTASSGGTAKGADGVPAGDAQAEKFTTPPPGIAPQVLWHRTAETDSISSDLPLRAHNGLLIISGDPLVARRATDGKAAWTRKGVAPAGAPLILADGKLFLVSTEYDGDVIGLDPDTGKEAWRSRLGGDLTVQRILAADQQRIHVIASVRTEDTTVHLTAIAAINIRTRTVDWQKPRDKGTQDYELEGVVAGGRLVYTDGRKNVTVRDAADGRQLWTRKIGEDIAWRPAVHAQRIFLGGERLRAVHLETGKDDWSLSSAGRLSFYQPMVVGDVLYAGDHSGGVWAVDPVRGRKLWLCEDVGARRAPREFVRVGNTLYGASYDDIGGIFALNPMTGKARWHYNDNTGNLEQWHVVASGGRLLVTHGDEIYGLPAV